MKKPRQCPHCGSLRIAEILYGYVDFSEKLKNELKAGRTTLGECCVIDDDPVWQCVDCAAKIYRNPIKNMSS